ncbi:NLI interacting factor-like phosphatase-domain-containing protein [Mycena metata]|uniref:Mitochondrial import inner membrane translocase subunit TIM50 n=1 Tax=Mycena metata TaxID=1033252 RepID=A0AAD7KAV8_9AGAR|nr:NLI interacting factor-like phosphatase-domain-containing protein [Mycena metata]
MAAPRKLLVLDLNGTLLLRSKRTRAGPSTVKFGTRARVVHPRPYLNSFRDYIFHPSTMEWLDTMVWSSAQPPSVADMVNHCFGSQQRKFTAIWARDTLGLPPALYDKKTPTTKDLSKPWAAFPEHSSRTTLLLDDSARKAHLHPHNHVCVREYLQETRKHDLEVLKANSPAAVPPKKQSKSKKAHREALVDLPVDAPPAWFLASSAYDETLLAIVGILETVKTRQNVAEWIRGGGLLEPQTKLSLDSSPPSPDSLAPKMAALNLMEAQELWFNSEATVQDWVSQGIHALEALQIPVVAGIHK